MPDWVVIVVSAAVALAGAALAAWAVFGDPAGRARCFRCGHDLRASRTFVCPECGRDARSRLGVFRARRRWGWATVGVAIIAFAGYAGSTLAAQRYAAGEGWTRLMPTWLLVALCDTGAYPNANAINRAVDQRFSRGGLAEWQWRWITWREFRVRPEHLANVVVTRTKWPAGVRPNFTAGWPLDPALYPRWGLFWDWEVTCRTHEAEPFRITTSSGRGTQFISEMPKTETEIEPPQQLGRHRVTFDIGYWSGGYPVKGQSTVEFEVVADLDEVLAPVDSPEIRDWVRANTVCWLETGTSQEVSLVPALDFRAQAAESRWWPRFAVVLNGREYELDPKYSAVRRFFPRATGAGKGEEVPWRSDWDVEVPANDAAAYIIEHASLKITCDAQMTLRLFESRTRWTGELIVPLRDVVKRPK